MKYLILLFVLISPLSQADFFDELHQECVVYKNHEMENIEKSELLDWVVIKQAEYGTGAALEMADLMNIIQCKNEQQRQLIKVITTKTGIAL